jgi:hypothetical protein
VDPVLELLDRRERGPPRPVEALADLLLHAPAQRGQRDAQIAVATAVVTAEPRPTSGWATWGGAAMFLGTGLQVTGVAGWAALYYFATDPSGDPAAVAPLLQTAGDDLRLFGVAAAGALIVALGTAAQAVGLWRSAALPRWVPIVSLAIVPTFFLPNAGLLGLITGIPICVAAAAIGHYAWRRAG